jgi:hypothetical protein
MPLTLLIKEEQKDRIVQLESLCLYLFTPNHCFCIEYISKISSYQGSSAGGDYSLARRLVCFVLSDFDTHECKLMNKTLHREERIVLDTGDDDGL